MAGRDKRRGGKKRHRGGLPYATRADDAVIVNGYSERWLRQGFPWVYDNEVVGRTGALVPGRVVRILNREGRSLGTGIWDGGRVEVRRYRRDDGPVDAALIGERVKQARARRPIPADTDAWRWVHGENDDLPGVRVDVWGTQLGITLDAPSLLGLLDPLVDVLVEEHQPTAIWLDWRPTKGEEARLEGLRTGLVWGAADKSEDMLVLESGMRFGVRPWQGHDAGLFCDMRDLRTWMRPHWRGRRVLNTFAYTGAFSVAAALGGAEEVVTVDLGGPYLQRAQDNFRANGLDPAAHRFVEADTFKALDTLRRKGERFQLVIADPPSHSHGPQGDWAVEKDLGRLIAACLRVLEPGGWLIVASNHGKLSPREFSKQIQRGGEKAGRRLVLLHTSSPPLDFPAALDFPESRYLKAWVLRA